MEKDDLKDELELYKERLENAMASGNLAWWEMELPSGEVKFNDRKAEMLGYSPKRFDVYSDFTDLVHPNDYEKAMQAMRDHLEGNKERYEVEYRIKKKNGDYKWFRDVGSITEQQDDYKKVTGIVIDIDERKEAEEREELLNSVLRHDIKNKAQIVQGYLQILEDKDIPKDIEDLVIKALTSNEEIMNLIKKVRLLLSAKKEVIKSVDMISMINGAVAASEGVIEEKGMKVEMKFPSIESKVEAGSLLKEAFSNLIENAAFHSEGKKIVINGKTTDDQFVCIIEDDGKGIPDEEKEKIFHRGYTTDEERGSGLGMFLVEMLVETYGGKIEVNDSELGGARFDVYLNKA